MEIPCSDSCLDSGASYAPGTVLRERESSPIRYCILISESGSAVDESRLVCALHGVSPRDRWLRVLPGWQMNVNVNVTNPAYM